jgi:hypothetical protein
MSPKKKEKKYDCGVSRLNLMFIVVIILVLFVSVLLGSGMLGKKAQSFLTATTDKGDYGKGNMMKVVLSNKSDKEICFSSCPYIFQYKNGNTWQEYQNIKCPEGEKVVARVCLSPKSSKTMGINLPSDRLYTRLEVPFCGSCNEGADFKETGKIYSNEFTIK